MVKTLEKYCAPEIRCIAILPGRVILDGSFSATNEEYQNYSTEYELE